MLLLLAIVIAIAIAAGFIGALVGLGGGIIIGPALVIFLHVPAVDAIGATAISVLGTSIATGAASPLTPLTDLRIGTVLQAATIPGAMVGVSLAIYAARTGLSSILLIVLGGVLLATVPGAISMRRIERPSGVVPDGLSRRLNLQGSYYDIRERREIHYQAGQTRSALGLFVGAGFLSGLLGIGSGVLNVLGLEREMKLPFKVATATSNFMIGATVAVSAGVLLIAGYVNPFLATGVGMGTVIGAYVGAHTLPGMADRTVRLLFTPILVVLGAELILRGLGYA